jgi:hypothetical protein
MLELWLVGDEKKGKKDGHAHVCRIYSSVLLYYSSERDIFDMDLFMIQDVLYT